MAEEPTVEAPKKSGTGIIFKIAMVAVAIIVPIVIGLVVFKFVLAPKLTEAKEEPKVEEQSNKIPETAVTTTFDQQIATLIMPPNSNVPASLLIYQVALECANPETAALVDKFRPRFTDMIREVHSNKTRAEVDDPLVLDSIKKQILQRSNEILRLAQAEPDPNIRITAVFHTQFTVQDQ